MPSPQILFKTPTLMVQQASSAEERVLHIISRNFGTIPISPEAAALLVDYLKVCKAFFSHCGHPRALRQVYLSIAEGLHKNESDGVLQKEAVTALIEELGCVTTWQRHYRAGLL